MLSPYHSIRFARQYDRIVRGDYPYHQHAARRLVLFAAPHDGQTVLDLGAGTGLVAEEVLRRCRPGVLLVVDASAAMLRVAQERLSAMPVAARTEVRYIVGDAARLTERIAPASVDLAIASYVMGWLHDPAAALRELALVLKPDGALVFDVPPPDDPPPQFLTAAPPFQVFHQALKTLLRERLGFVPSSDQLPARPLDYAAWLRLAQAAGFTVEATLREEVAFSPDEVEAVWRSGWWFSTAANPALRRLPATRVQAVVDEAMARTQASADYTAWRASGAPLWETYAAVKLRRA